MSGVETTETAPSELIILQDNHGCAEIGGVFFDFRHPLLTEDWRPSYGLGWAGTSSLKLLAPVHVVFPWTRYEPTPALDELAGLSGMAALRWTVEHGPSGHADVGDRVFIRSVRRVVIGDEFEAEPDGTYLSVRYAVERPCGRIDRIRGRSSYLHRDRDWGDSTKYYRGEFFTEGVTLEGVARRLTRLFRPGDMGEDGEPGEQCEPNAALCWDALANLSGPAPQSDLERQWRERAILKAGYFLAKAEAAALMRPLAERGVNAQQSARAAARKRREQTDPIRSAARAFIQKSPGTSKSACARHVAQLLGKDQRGVERAISELFEPRNLGAGKRDMRPRKDI